MHTDIWAQAPSCLLESGPISSPPGRAFRRPRLFSSQCVLFCGFRWEDQPWTELRMGPSSLVWWIQALCWVFSTSGGKRKTRRTRFMDCTSFFVKNDCFCFSSVGRVQGHLSCPSVVHSAECYYWPGARQSESTCTSRHLANLQETKNKTETTLIYIYIHTHIQSNIYTQYMNLSALVTHALHTSVTQNETIMAPSLG